MKQPSDARDFGTAEFHRKHQVIEIPTEDAGIMAAQVVEECLLDSLYRRGKLTRKSDTAPEQIRRRYDAGLWLRRLYENIGLRTRSTMAYSVFGQAGSPKSDFIDLGAEEDDNDLSKPAPNKDAQNWNWRCWRETLKGVGYFHSTLLVAVCCTDTIPNQNRCDLRHSLERLAHLRGM